MKTVRRLPLSLSALIPARDLGPARGRRYTQHSDSLRFSVIDKIVISPTRHTGPREGRGPLFFVLLANRLGVSAASASPVMKTLRAFLRKHHSQCPNFRSPCQIRLDATGSWCRLFFLGCLR